jgi:dihydrolipoamide dehydrogenase
MVGKSWKELEGQENVVVGKISFEGQGRSRVILKNKGLMHLYADQNTGLFLGSEFIGPHAEHLAHLLSWAHQQKMKIPQMLEMPFYHPVIEEGLRTGLSDVNDQLSL